MMKKDLIVVLILTIVMPLYFFSNWGYSAQSSKPDLFPVDRGDGTISDDSALNASNVDVYTAMERGGETN